MEQKKYFRMPLVIENETEKAVLVEGFGWFPKSQVFIQDKEFGILTQWVSVPAWLAYKKSMVPPAYMMKKSAIVVEWR